MPVQRQGDWSTSESRGERGHRKAEINVAVEGVAAGKVMGDT